MKRAAILLACCGCLTYGVPRQDCKGAGICIDDVTYDWPLLYGGPDDQVAEAIAVGDDGSLYVAGTFATGLELDDLALTPTATTDNPGAANVRWGYLAKLNKKGQAQWASKFGGPTSIVIGNLALTDDGVALGGSFLGALEANNTVLRSPDANASIYVIKFTDDTGAISWASDLSPCTACATAPLGTKEFGGIAADENGSLYVGGNYKGHFGCDEANCTSANPEELFFARLAGSDGTLELLNLDYSGANRDVTRDLVYDGNSSFYMAGDCGPSLTFPGPAGTISSSGPPNMFVAKLDKDGSATWAVAMGANGPDNVSALALDANNAPVLAGRISQALAIPGGDTLAAPAVCIVGLSPSDGAIAWGTAFPAATQTVPQINLIKTTTGLVVAGFFNSTLGIGSVSYESIGKEDIFIAGLDFAGEVVWSNTFGDVESDRGMALAPSGSDVLLVGDVDSTIDFGGGDVTPNDKDAFVVRFDSSGELL